LAKTASDVVRLSFPRFSPFRQLQNNLRGGAGGVGGVAGGFQTTSVLVVPVVLKIENELLAYLEKERVVRSMQEEVEY
jgi:hypothetical protein